MTTDEYVPSEAHFRDYYVGGRSEYDPEYTDDMAARRDWGAFLARVRRDAERSALDGLADEANHVDWQMDGPSFALRVRRFKNRNYPEENRHD